MNSAKLIFGSILVAVVLAVLGAGGAYLLLSFREADLERDFQLVRSLQAQSDFDRAQEVLDGRLDSADGTEPWFAQALAMMLDLQQARGDETKAVATAERLLDPQATFSGDAVHRAHAYLGWRALEAGNASAAQPHFEAIIEQAAPDGVGVDVAMLGMARLRMASRGVSVQVRKDLEAMIERFPDSDFRADAEFALGQCNLGLLYSPAPIEGDVIYEIASGDTIDRVARDHEIPSDLLMRVNGIRDPRRLSIGKRIKIPEVAFSIEVNKSDNTLTLLNHGRFFKRYRVRTGSFDYLTPVGEFKVLTKKKDPAWNDPKSGKYFPPSHPENQLGTRWIGFQGSSFGIHGTIEPETIGHYASNGCVGMHKEDVEELYDLIRRGTAIRIFGQIEASEGSADASPVG